MATIDDIRSAVLQHLRERGIPPSIGEMAEEIRHRNDNLRQVSDFDFRSTVLRMMAVGDVELTPANRITIPAGSLAVRG